MPSGPAKRRSGWSPTLSEPDPETFMRCYQPAIKLDPDIYGGAPLLGLNGTVIKAHGSANARAIKDAIRVATETIQHHLNASIGEEIAKTNESVTAATANS